MIFHFRIILEQQKLLLLDLVSQADSVKNNVNEKVMLLSNLSVTFLVLGGCFELSIPHTPY